MLLGGPAQADAQIDVRVDATVWWESDRNDPRYDGRHHPRYDDRDPYYHDRRYRHRRHDDRWYRDRGHRGRNDRARGVRVPPGHLPPPGMCLAWFPGVPPGRQAPARPCWELYEYGLPYGSVLVAPGGQLGLDRRGPPAHAGPPGKARKRGRGKRGRGPRW